METDTASSQNKNTKTNKTKRRRNDRRTLERDRERKRMKRLNPDYRMMEQERDRERKKALRSNEAFRTLEKIRDRMRKERKRFCGELRTARTTTKNSEDITIVREPLIEPEVILSTTEYPQQYQPHTCSHHFKLPQQCGNTACSENPEQNRC